MIIKERDNYLAVFDILLTVTLLSNSFNDELEKDAEKVINFIGGSFKLDEKTLEECRKYISNELTMLSTTHDVEAFLSNRGYLEYPKIANLLYLKMQALVRIDSIYNLYEKEQFNQQHFDYDDLRPYFSSIRYQELESSSIKGNIYVNRTVALMLALGIGCKQNIKSAIYRLKQCAYWGDISSLCYLSHIYALSNDEKNQKLYADLFELSRFTLEGRTIIPEDIVSKYDEKTNKEYALIASINQDIVLSYNQPAINFSFLEVILMDKLDYFTKMQLINNYNSQAYREYTNSSSDPSKRLGFKKGN